VDRLEHITPNTIFEDDGSSSELETELTPTSKNKSFHSTETSQEHISLDGLDLYDDGVRWKIKTFICKRKGNQSLGQSGAEVG
jgi:GTP-dependent phosphoenolpyruvate carboxykinase